MPEVNPNPFQSEQHNADAHKERLDAIAEERKRNEAALKTTLRAFFVSDQGKHFERYIRNVIAGRTYFPLETDMASVAFAEGTRYLAMQIADLAGLDLVNFNR